MSERFSKFGLLHAEKSNFVGSEKFFIRQFLLSYFFDYDDLFRTFRDSLSTPVNVFEFNFTI